jgi:sugar phosphate isomerase/epimerase
MAKRTQFEATLPENNIELLASYWTISAAYPDSDHDYSPFDFADRVRSAARTGFKGVGIWHADLEHVLRNRSLEEMKQVLDDNGMKYVELEFLIDWFVDGERKRKSNIRKNQLLEAAEVLQASHVKVSDVYREKIPMGRLIDAFAQLCADGAEHGTRIAFELNPFAMLDTLKASLAMIEGAGAENGGIVLDLWHLTKLKVPYEEVSRIPVQYLVSVELNDGIFEPPWSLYEEMVNHRHLCGEGEFDIKGFIASVRETGYAGPWGVEVLSEDLRNKPLDELTRRSFDTTMSQFRAS